MKLHIENMCRGDGKGYIKLKVEGDLAGKILKLKCQLDEHRVVPGNLYILEHENGIECSVECVAVIPLLAVQSQHLTIFVEDEKGVAFGSAFLDVSMRELKWRSRFAYALQKEAAAELRDIDKTFIHRQITAEFTQCIVDGSETIVHTKFNMPHHANSNVQITALDAYGSVLDVPLIVMSDSVVAPERVEEVARREIVVSIRIPNSLSQFCVFAEDTATDMQCGFQCMEEEGYRRELEGYHRETLSAATDPHYEAWLESHKATIADLIAQREKRFEYEPLISIIVPVFNTPKAYFSDMLKSVLMQSYENWELILVNASSENTALSDILHAIKDTRVYIVDLPENMGIVGNTNAGIEASSGAFVAFLDHDDIIEPDALFEYVRAMNAHEDCDLIYCDEDSVTDAGIYSNAHFKSDFNKDLLFAHNYITHFLMIRRSIIDQVGMSPEYVNGAQDYDLILRVTEKARFVQHVSKVLYHWRIHANSTSSNADSKPYAHEAGKRALADSFERQGISVDVVDSGIPFVYRQRYRLHVQPKVSIIIPNKDQANLLESCVRSILGKSTYKNYEIVIVENNSVENETDACYERLTNCSDKVSILRYTEVFNFSKIVNFGARHTEGDILLLLNNDTEVVSPDFLEEMVGYCSRADVGVVGAKLLYRDRTVQHAGVVVGPHGLAAHLNCGIPENVDGYFGRATRTQNLSAVTGACQMIPRKVFEQVGGYSEEYTVGFNDVDFCLKVREAGYLVVFNPYAKLFHYEFTSRGKDEPLKKRIRSEREKALMHYRWPEYFIIGDEYYNKNLDRNSLYFGLGR